MSLKLIELEFIQHFENLLGKINSGLSVEIDCNKFQVVEILNNPLKNSITYASLGFSDVIFDSVKRYEFLMSINNKYKEKNINEILFSAIEYIYKLNKEIKLGDVIKREGELIKNSDLKNLFCYVPFYFQSESLYVFKKSFPYVYFGWLILINDKELEYIKTNGWKKFVDLLEEKDPDLLDIYRLSII